MPESSAAVPAPNSTPSDATVLYSEKLWPNFWIWLVAAGLSGAGILVFAPISTGRRAHRGGRALRDHRRAAGPVHRRPSLSPASTLRVGRATIERRFVGTASAFRGKEATAERGTRLNGLAFLCIRGWIDPVVRIEITDPSDRTPYWLTSTRHPDELLAALNGS